MIKPDLTIDLEQASYPVYIKGDILDSFHEISSDLFLPSNIFVIADSAVWNLYSFKLESFLANKNYSVFEVKGGKSCKNFSTVLSIFQEMDELNFPRNTLIIAFGGGVIGDLAAFVASCWYR
ncbi:3-dehydroquinate synthase family protein [Synechococcus sp. TAK9802]|nr:3-dehydroquinate synthase family protein [Synechococcus sp. TAK9802]